MAKLIERIETLIQQANDLNETLNKTNWGQLNREGFLFELVRTTKKFKTLYLDLEETNRELKLMLEKGTPVFDNILNDIARELTILESNINLERTTKLRENIVNSIEKNEVPELYASIQEKILAIVLTTRHALDKAKTFILSKQNSFVKKGSTAKALIEMLEQKENELKDVKEKHFELKRKNFFGSTPEKSISDIERELFDSEKNLAESITESSKTLKNHAAQLTYAEGSLAHMKSELDKVEERHTTFSKKALTLIQELKKERDFAKNMALEIEHETISIRNSYTHQLLDLERKKSEIEESAREKYAKQLAGLRKETEEKTVSIINLNKMILEQEKEIDRLKRLLEKANSTK